MRFALPVGRLARTCTAVAFSSLLLIVGYMASLHASNNFHEVVPNEFYRSAQLNGPELTDYLRRYHIRSVINLRGQNLDKAWYREEIAAVAAAGVEHIDFGIKSSQFIDDARMIQLVETMKNAPKPVLIHCQGGADRTGLASALYLAAIKKESEFLSELQLSFLYGHFSIYFDKAYAMNDSFEAFEPILGFEGS